MNKKKLHAQYTTLKKADWQNTREYMAAFRDQHMENKRYSNSVESDWDSFKSAISNQWTGICRKRQL